jgi:hypothetical protein
MLPSDEHWLNAELPIEVTLAGSRTPDSDEQPEKAL